METFKLSAEARVDFGKSSSKNLRKDGRIPCVLYGGSESVHFSVKENDMRNLVYTPDVYNVVIDIDGNTYETLIKELQFHPVTDRLLHVDFQELVADKQIAYSVPIKICGSAKGVMQGGKLRLNMRRLSLRATKDAMIEKIEIDVSDLGIGKSVRVGDIQLENIDVLNAKNAVIVAVKMARGAASSEEEEEVEGTEENTGTAAAE